MFVLDSIFPQFVSISNIEKINMYSSTTRLCFGIIYLNRSSWQIKSKQKHCKKHFVYIFYAAVWKGKYMLVELNVGQIKFVSSNMHLYFSQHCVLLVLAGESVDGYFWSFLPLSHFFAILTRKYSNNTGLLLAYIPNLEQ